MSDWELSTTPEYEGLGILEWFNCPRCGDAMGRLQGVSRIDVEREHYDKTCEHPPQKPTHQHDDLCGRCSVCGERVSDV